MNLISECPSIIRVFPRRTKWTPTDELSFVGDPPLFLPPEHPVKISVTFTWDIPEGTRLARAWKRHYSKVEIGGPAFGDPGGDFTPGRFVREGVVVTSRGCTKSCAFCLVPKREGSIRELKIKDGWNVFDNNLLACSRDHIEDVFEMLRRQPKPINFTGGIDKNLLESWHVDLFKSIRLKRMWLACDSDAGFPALERAADILSDFPKEKKWCYVLVKFKKETPQDAEKRLTRIFDLGFMPFSMLYRSENSTKKSDDTSWRKLINIWCNPARYKSIMKQR